MGPNFIKNNVGESIYHTMNVVFGRALIEQYCSIVRSYTSLHIV